MIVLPCRVSVVSKPGKRVPATMYRWVCSCGVSGRWTRQHVTAITGRDRHATWELSFHNPAWTGRPDVSIYTEPVRYRERSDALKAAERFLRDRPGSAVRCEVRDVLNEFQAVRVVFADNRLMEVPA